MDPLLLAAAGFLAKGIVEGVIEGSAKEAVAALRNGPAKTDKVLAVTLDEVQAGRGGEVNLAVLTELIKSHAESDARLAGLLREVYSEATAGQVGQGGGVVNRNEQVNRQWGLFGRQESTQINKIGGSPEADPKV